MALPEVGLALAPLTVQSCGPQIGGEEELRELYLAPPPPCMGPPNYPGQGPRTAHRGGHQAHRGHQGEGGHHHRSKSNKGGSHETTSLFNKRHIHLVSNNTRYLLSPVSPKLPRLL